ncbi:MAG: protein-L-isoaspartate(D-aspartate) O-methyltransferase [Armatimonadetes bacterium]|nr:protein-L-isoaspartate(D-aspartate) O-methyltransferase [Armatimonadota bacterium]
MSGTASRPVARAAAARLWGLAVCVAVAAAGLCGCRAAPQPSREEAVRHPPDVRLRRMMVRTQIRARGVKDERVLAAMETVPRAEFVPSAQRPHAYEDRPLSIGEEQTISQPYIVALMTELLEVKEGDRVLEIGTGSGYQAAVLAELTPHVYTIEIIPTLAERAEETLRRLGYDSVEVKAGDGYLGWPDRAPFDGIIVTCAPEEVPEPLKEQLREGGRMVIPVGPQWTHQTLYVLTKNGDTLEQKEIIPVRFVPMVR